MRAKTNHSYQLVQLPKVTSQQKFSHVGME